MQAPRMRASATAVADPRFAPARPTRPGVFTCKGLQSRRYLARQQADHGEFKSGRLPPHHDKKPDSVAARAKPFFDEPATSSQLRRAAADFG